MKKYLFLMIGVMVMMGCARKNTGVVIEDPVVVQKVREIASPVKSIPNATIFRMNGNYAKNVAITLNGEGQLVYFPAPSDITADSAPVDLGDGWWLNCQGFGANSVFTKYTFAEDSELVTTPTPEQLKMEIIPGSKVTEFREVPVSVTEALQNPEIVKQYLH